MVVVLAADCGSSGDGHLHVAVVLVGVKFYPVRTWYTRQKVSALTSIA